MHRPAHGVVGPSAHGPDHHPLSGHARIGVPPCTCANSATRTPTRTGSANVGVIGATLAVVLGARCGHRAVKTMARGVDEGIQQADTLRTTPTNGRASTNAPEGT